MEKPVPRRRLGWIIAAALMIAAVGAAGAWLARETTLAAAARLAVERSDGALRLDGVSGTLLRRIHVDRAVWRASGRDVVVDDASFEWSPLWLLLATLSFHDVRVGAATVTLVDTESAPVPPTLPQSLRLPLRVRVHDTVVDRLNVVHGGEPGEATRLAFDGEAGWQSWTLTVNESTTPLGTMRGRLEVGASAPYRVDGHLQVRREGDLPLAIDVAASGSLANAVEIKAALRAQSSSADASVVYAPLAAQPIVRADAALHGVDLRHLVRGAPEATFDGKLDAAANGGELRGDLRIANRVPGTVDAGRLPLVSLAARVGLAAGALALDDIAADFGAAGAMSGNGRLGFGEASFELAGEGLDLHGVHTALEPTRFKATVDGRGDVESQTIRATLTQPAYRATFDGTLAADAITIREARVSVGKGYAEAKGSVSLDPEHRFDLEARLSRFDPSRLGRFRPASLNARVAASGSLRPVVQVRAAIDVAPSTAFGLPTTAKVQWRSRGVDDPQIAIDGAASIGQTKIALNGRLVDPADLRSLDLTLDLAGRDLAQLYTITNLPFPSTPDYRLTGRLRYDDHVWSFRRFSGRVGRSDLSGDFVVDLRDRKPFMRIAATSQNLDMRDLGGFVGASEKAPPNPPGRVLPRGEFHLDKLNAANADVRFTGQRISNETLPLERMTTHLVLRDGVLTLDPIAFGTAAGNLEGKVTMDARQPTIATVVDISGEDVRLERFAPGIRAMLQETGPVSTRLRLTMHGNSVAAMLGTADGDIALAMTGGRISDLALRLADLDLANALAVMARDRNRSVAVRCLVGRLTAHDGVLTPEELVLDAEHTTAAAEGRIDLRNETLDLRVTARPKQFTAFALRGPVLVTGSLQSPKIGVDWKSAIARGGAAIALGVAASPAAAVLPFVQLGTGETFNCGSQVQAIVAQIRGQNAAAASG